MITVIGTGTMGKGIAIELASYNFDVLLISMTDNFNEMSIKREIEDIANKFKLQNIDDILHRISISNNISKISNSDLIIEAIVENLEMKRKMLTSIQEYVNKDTIIASNTSSLAITRIFEGIFKLDKVIGLHFFNPVQIMKLVEISYTNETSLDSKEFAINLIHKLKKEYVLVKDSPGFIVNRILIPMINEASKIIDEGIATAEDIDKAMKFGANHPIGPLKLSDLIGNDVTLSILKILSEYNDDINISSKLVELVDDNKNGRKTKHGYYEYI